MIYYVSVKGSDAAAGSKEAPFKTINHAAGIAKAGDTVKVFGGVYREWVDPKNSGSDENNRIIYEAVEGETPVIKGYEVITDWERVEGTVWKKVIPNSFFGNYNPYAEKLLADWLIAPTQYDVHPGEVYINGKAMYEAKSLEEVYTAPKRERGVVGNLLADAEGTVYQWRAVVDNETTTLYCNFQNFNPNKELIEINVRKCCFYPKETGVNYITLRGFEIAQSACPFVPPTADQWGMVGPHWSKGWIIENNHLHDAKCSAVSLGKEASTGDNEHTKTRKKAGYTYQKEAVFASLLIGWNKENIGSHIVRNNVIHDCGQNGVVGHLGCVFSEIKHNHIYNIAVKQEFHGHELGGIKLHAAIDVVIENNNIHNCKCFGTWLDWQAQGTAFVHNIFAGFVWENNILDRQTPYHFPHTTAVKGCEPVYGGDDRFINNMFLGIHTPIGNLRPFCTMYDRFCLPDEYFGMLKPKFPISDHKAYMDIPQYVIIEGNAYSGRSVPYRAEKDFVITKGMTASISEKDGEWKLSLTVPSDVLDMKLSPVTTERLGTPRITE
ncbi:MAG: DUF1565 domain-containing protein [Ruminococcaceae bacterium]|nr:DUF1565 domain-containing protein [Oscillospiraceae bacterium]